MNITKEIILNITALCVADNDPEKDTKFLKEAMNEIIAVEIELEKSRNLDALVFKYLTAVQDSNVLNSAEDVSDGRAQIAMDLEMEYLDELFKMMKIMVEDY